MEELTNSAKNTTNGRTVFVTNNLVLPQNIGTNTFHDPDLCSTLVVQLTHAEGEGAKLLHNLGQRSPRAWALQTISGGGPPEQSGPVIQRLHLSGAQAYAHLYTPDFSDFRKTLALDTFSWCQYD